MNRVLLFAIAFVFVGIIAFAGFLFSSGSRQEQAPLAPVEAVRAPAPSTPAPAAPTPQQPPATEPAQTAGQEPSEDGAPSQVITDNPEAHAAFTRWAARLERAGLAFAADAVGFDDEALVISQLQISGAAPAFDWQWVAASARIQLPEAPRSVLSMSGDQAFSLTRGRTVSKWSGPVERLEVKVQAAENRPFTTMSGTARGLELTSGSEAPAISLASGEIEINLGAGTVPPSKIELTDFALPVWANGVFGPIMDSLKAELGGNAGSSGLAINNMELQWGALALSGEGSVSLGDDLRPSGQLDVEIADVLAALDTLAAAQKLDPARMAETYALLLQAMTTSETLAFAITIGEGMATLIGTPYAIDEIPLFDVLPVTGATSGG